MNKNKKFQFVLVLLFLATSLFAGPAVAQEEVVIDEDRDNPDIVVPTTPLQAIAGEDKNVVVGRQVLFSGAASTGPADQLLQYKWDFGDGQTGEGVDITHVYENSGVYRITLTVSYEDQSSVDEVIVAVDKDIALLITDTSVSSETIAHLQSHASTQGVLLVNLHVAETGLDYQVESSLAQIIIDNKEDIKPATRIILWTKHNIGLNALIEASQELDKIDSLEPLGFKNKDIFVLTDQSLAATSRIAQTIYNLLRPQALVLTTQAANEILVTDFDINNVFEQLKSNDIEYQLLGLHTQRPLTQLKPWNFLSYMVNYMVNNGVPLNTIYLILILPVIATIIAFARQVIGVKAFGIYAPSLVAVSFLATGLKWGLGIFIMVLIIGTLGRLVARKTRLMYLPRMAIVLTLVSLSILLLFFFGAFLDRSDLTVISIFPILIMVIITEKFVAAQIEQGSKTAWKLVLETLILAIICYYIANWETFRVILLGYPEWIFLTLVLNFLFGRWVGLRLLELYRFRKVLKYVNLAEKK
jgi:hypothetical protein